jgi:hypothetical protein
VRIVSGKRVKIVREVQNATVQPNDMLVSLSSSRLPQYIPMRDVARNHATVADAEMAQLLIQLIKTTQSLQ